MFLCRLLLLLCVALLVTADGEYDPKTPAEGDGHMSHFDLPPASKDTPQGGRDESRDPSKWIMNLVSTKLPPHKRYRRPTTAKPQALAQGATDGYDIDKFGLSVSPE